MKKWKFFLMAALLGAHTAAWADYSHLYVVNAAGSSQTLDLSGLRLTFESGNVVAAIHGEQVYTAALSSLDYMTFTEPTGIGRTETDAAEETVSVYDVRGCLVAEDRAANLTAEHYPKGVYVVKGQQGTRKIIVR